MTMKSTKIEMYPLSNEHATIIKNLLHNERIRYQAIDGVQASEGHYYNLITDAIKRMEHPEEYYPT
mgnify:CR=1 FL=1